MNKRDLHATWDLQRFWFTDDNGVEVDPLGTGPAGNLILGTDGQYAFNMMRRDRSPYASGDLLGGTAEEKGEAADGYVSFGGTWSFDGEAFRPASICKKDRSNQRGGEESSSWPETTKIQAGRAT